ncbi:MAG: glycosyltransferase family 39 protein [Bacteroidota bacterium]
MQSFLQSERKYLFLLSLFWLLAVIFVNPIGDFPLNDDGIYSRWLESVFFENTNNFQNIIVPNLFLQAVWGKSLCELSGGFSLTTLRFSTLILAYFSIFLTYSLCQSVLKDRYLSLIIAIALVFNPIFFSLSHTFMTDVPFLFFLLASLYCYSSFFQAKKIGFRISGFLFGICAFLIRQPGIIAIFVFELGILFFSDRSKSYWTSFALFIAMLLIGYFGVKFFMKDYLVEKQAFASPIEGFFQQLKKQPSIFLFQLIKRALMTVFYLGLFSLPFVVPFFKKLIAINRLKIAIFLPILFFNITITYLLNQTGYTFPYGGNIFYDWGLGPVLLPDVHRYGITTLPQLPKIMVMSFGLICQIYGCYLVIYCVRLLFQLKTTAPKNQFLLLFTLFNACSLIALLSFNFFDRYLLAPTLAIWLLLSPSIDLKPKVSQWSIIIILTLYATFAVLGTKDYLNWNKAVKTAFVKLQEQKVSIEDIDAGVGFNEFYKDDPYDANEEYLITRGDIEGYVKQDSVGVFQYLWWEEQWIYTLKKK